MNSKKIIYKQIVTLVSVCFLFLCGTPVWAGDINENEQKIINFYNGTFSYEGKVYVATEAAKASAYNKLMADDVDLSASQARSAILQAKNSVKEGIDRGYLIEQVADTEPNTESDTELGTESEQYPVEGEQPDSEQTTETIEDTEAPDENENEKKPDKKKDKKIDKIINKELEDPYSVIVLPEDSSSAFIPENVGEAELNTVTIESHKEGVITSYTEDGDVAFQTTLPIKNTGYHAMKMEHILLLLAGFSMVVFMMTGIYLVRNYEEVKKEE